MPTSKGGSAVRSFIAGLPAEIEGKLLRGAARAAATVVADEAKSRTHSSRVRGAIRVATSAQEGRIVAKVQVKGPGAYLAPWEEYGTRPHLISVDESQRHGMSIGRINKLASEPGQNHSLVIGGKFVGKTVMHPGAKPHPFLRPALDTKEGEAIEAAQAYIDARITPGGITGDQVEGDDDGGS
jgi:HK97 gp10 family phage protein